MTAYLLKFILCSGLLLLVYRAFLGTERLYKFNRFYLLFSLVFSLMVPAITIHVPYMKMPVLDKFFAGKPAVISQQPAMQTGVSFNTLLKTDGQVQPQMADRVIDVPNNNINNELIGRPAYIPTINSQYRGAITSAPKPARNYLPEILLALYGAVALLLLFRFVRNSYRITKLINESTVINYQDTKLVLVKDDVTPHSFLKYVFLNKDAYRNKTIEPEIICHEQTHVRQLHSLDVIWVELFQVVCWFNPFIPLYRKAIQLNHEFLADEAVIENYNDTPAYQYLLLAKASQCGGLFLTSQFNYLVTKKRLIMMTKNTTAAIALYKRLALVPVLAVALFLFSQKIMAQNAPKAKPAGKAAAAKNAAPKVQLKTVIEAANQDAPQSLLDEYSTILAKYHIPYKQGEKIDHTPDFATVDNERLTALYKQMSAKQQQHQYIRLVYFFPPPVLRFTQKDLVTWQNNTGYIVYIDDKQINNADLAKYKVTDFRSVQFKQQPVPSAKEGWHWKVTLMTPDYYKEYVAKLRSINYRFIYIPKKDWKSTNWRIAGATDASAKPQVKFDGPVPASAQNDAPQSLLDEYSNILAKYHIPYKQGEKINYTPDFATSDKERLTALYKQMSVKQQQHQYVRLGPLFPPPLLRFTIDDTVNFQDKTIYVNDKKVAIAELSRYGTTLGYVTSIKASKRNEVRLNTRAYYKKYSDNLPKMHFFYIPKKDWKATNWRIAGATYASVKPKVKFDGPVPASAQNDAPQSILDEYATIEKKYCFYAMGKDQKMQSILMMNVADEDRQRLISLFEQMSKAQQQKQSLKFIAMRPPMPKITPSERDLNNWKNPSQYGVWVNDKKIKNEELNKYRATDFDHYFVSFLYPAARAHVKYHYQISLMTKTNYAQYHVKEIAKAKKDKYYLKADFNNFKPEINASARSVTQKDALIKMM